MFFRFFRNKINVEEIIDKKILHSNINIELQITELDKKIDELAENVRICMIELAKLKEVEND